MFWGLPFQSRQHRGFQGGGTARSMDRSQAAWDEAGSAV